MSGSDLTGQTFGRLTVISPDGYHRWQCRCECGVTVVKYSNLLLSGHCKSCGCLKKESLNQTTHGMVHSAEYSVWQGIWRRCTNPRDKNYHYYGGAGIIVCERWKDFAAFFEDMGTRPSDKHSIDRIDSTGNYEQSNCRWATAKEQANNQSRNVRLHFAGQTHTLKEWSEKTGLSYAALRHRHERGWSAEELLTVPVRVLRRGNGDCL